MATIAKALNSSPILPMDRFQEVIRQGREAGVRYCFVIGAGASKSSGIPDASEMVKAWLEKLKLQAGAADLKEWLKSERQCIVDLERPAQSYSDIYDTLYGDCPSAGYAYMESAMADARPKLGYAILARILAETDCRIAITTNFDNLIADALTRFARVQPLVCDHEFLAMFAREPRRRPLICKIHRDLLRNPQSGRYETAHLKAAWRRVLLNVFINFTPIFIGYAGNDRDLMTFLQKRVPRDTFSKGFFWVARPGSAMLNNQAIVDVVRRHNGQFVVGPPLRDTFFDGFMFNLCGPFGVSVFDPSELRRGIERELAEYETDLMVISKQVAGEASSQVKNGGASLLPAAQSSGRKAVDWQVRIWMEPDQRIKRSLYEKALEVLTKDVELRRNFANFLYLVCGDIPAAREQFTLAFAIKPRDPALTISYAWFIAKADNAIEEAETLLEGVVKDHPKDTSALGALGFFLHTQRGDKGRAETIYKQVCTLDPENALNFANYSELLLQLGRCNEARQNLLTAWNKCSKSPTSLCAAIAFDLAVANKLVLGTDDGILSKLKQLLQRGLMRSGWDFHATLAMTENLDPTDQRLFKGLAAAIQDEACLNDLNSIDVWRHLPSIASEQL